ncbi:hypothetical protein EW146_g4524 [Bondarzewia mesenterica]|uniref:Uncharacterized protein n=1 Tax=Bondarzewia mesenterica TaxID=1095465 RepID=A0A4S4LUF8_9AGAM|nr:hypothetical protein EW146_g4524 [Bondarzewia mesenterica]
MSTQSQSSPAPSQQLSNTHPSSTISTSQDTASPYSGSTNTSANKTGNSAPQPATAGSAEQSARGTDTIQATLNADIARSESTANVSTTATAGDSDSEKLGFGDEVYPPQRHAGAVGYGPEYGKGVASPSAQTFPIIENVFLAVLVQGLGEKLAGLKEQVKGKLTKKPELVEKGRERKTGQLKKKEQEAEVNSLPLPPRCDPLLLVTMLTVELNRNRIPLLPPRTRGNSK